MHESITSAGKMQLRRELESVILKTTRKLPSHQHVLANELRGPLFFADGATGTLPKERQSQEHHERSLGVGPHTFILGEEDQLQDTPRADAALVVGGSTSPSPRCARREEWRGPCYAWSGASHNRYLRILPLKPREGMGANLMRVASMLNRAILFDLEPIFVGPLVAGHDVGDFGPWIGLVDNPAMAVRDPAGYERAVVQHVPESVQSDYTWLHERQQDTSVIFEIDPNAARKIKDWGIPVSPLPSDPHVCSYVAQALRGAFWSVPSQRSRCRPYLSESRDQTGGGRPWVIAVHVRRGDMIRFRGGARSMPHAYFVAAVRSVLLGIAASAPGTQVTLLIFTESRMTLGENQLLQEDGKVVTWDIARESCEEIGLNCSQVKT